MMTEQELQKMATDVKDLKREWQERFYFMQEYMNATQEEDITEQDEWIATYKLLIDHLSRLVEEVQ